MNETDLAKEIESLRSQREQAIANINALGGALQFAEQMLAKMHEQNSVQLKEMVVCEDKE